jgi:hypothetical protein
VEIIAQLGSLLGLSFVSGINLYATVAVVGICSKYHLVAGLPPELHVLGHPGVIFVALFLYLVEFLMDKIPGLDTLWDSIHTFIRPLGGALLALLQVGEASPALEVIVFLLGASLASAAHVSKAATRLLVNLSPEPFSNIAISLGEDVAVVSLSYLSLAHPRLSLLMTLALLGLVALAMPLLLRAVRMLWGTLLFKVKRLIRGDAVLESSLELPPGAEEAFQRNKETDESCLWIGRGYAARAPGVPRFARVHLVMSQRALYLLYRRRLRNQALRLPRDRLTREARTPGRLWIRWVWQSAHARTLIYLLTPASPSIPEPLDAPPAVAHVP